jgi:hypothetical protein
MEVKLIKVEDEFYNLVGKEDLELIASDDEVLQHNYKIGKLSTKNCQAIERGYDLDELISESDTSHLARWTSDSHQLMYDEGFKIGFQKALELMGDKKFSEEDIRKAMDRVWDWLEDDKDEDCSSMTELRNKHIQSLQQTEWDCTFNSDEKDSEGCLILKKL